MEKEIVQGDLGSVGHYDVAFTGGKLVAKLDAAAGPAAGKMEVAVDAGKVIDALAAAIPGKLDDAVFALIKTALLS